MLAGVLARSSYGITWCFDWVAYEINGHHDTNRNNAGTLRALLCERGYSNVLTVTATTNSARPTAEDLQLDIEQLPPPAPQVRTALQPGDVLIFGTSHTGIVRSDGRLDHFLQDPKAEGRAYTPVQVAAQPNYFVGPGKSWTVQEVFAVSRALAAVNNDDFDPRSWVEWLGRSIFGPPKQYPFLHETAQVWRVVPGAGSGSGPGCEKKAGTTTTAPTAPPPPKQDLSLTLTFQGVSEKRDEKTDAETPKAGVTADVQSGSSYGGTVSVAGTVPTGDVVYVVFGITIVAVLGPGGGGFSGVTEPKGFGADTTVGAFVCKQGAHVGQSAASTTGCLAEGADVSAQWTP